MLMALAAQAKLADQRAVALEIVLLQVVQETAATTDQHQQAAARVVVMLVLAQVLRQVVDAMRQQRNLDLGLPGVVLVLAELRDDLALLLCGHAHVRSCRLAAATRSRPPSLAAYSASSARCTSSSGASPSQVASPMLIVIGTGVGAPATSARMRSAKWTAASAGVSGSSTRNSSPPRRPSASSA